MCAVLPQEPGAFDFSSNDYLGLARSAELQRLVQKGEHCHFPLLRLLLLYWGLRVVMSCAHRASPSEYD